MKSGSIVLMLGAAGVLLTLGGCASMSGGGGSGAPDPNAPVAVDINGLPQTVLAGATVANARAQAMALARVRGWEIKRAAVNQLVLERPLDRDLQQSAAPGAGGSPTLRRVETNLVDGSGGAIVALRLMDVSTADSGKERVVDVTSQSQAQIDASFRSLQQAWARNRNRIATPLPVPNQEQVQARAEDLIAKPSTAAAAPAVAPTRPVTPAPAAPAPAAPAPVAPVARAAPRTAAPVLSTNPAMGVADSAASVPMTVAPAATSAAPAARNDLVALSGASPRPGLWAYYAEDYAHLNGCTPDGSGARLLTRTGASELYEVRCTGGGNFVMSCQEGACQQTR